MHHCAMLIVKTVDYTFKKISTIWNISRADYIRGGGRLQDFLIFFYLVQLEHLQQLFLGYQVEDMKAAAVIAHLAKRAWNNTVLPINTKTKGYQACMLNTLPYNIEAWTLLWPRTQTSFCTISGGVSVSLAKSAIQYPGTGMFVLLSLRYLSCLSPGSYISYM